MPKIATWRDFPAAVRQHLVARMHDRKITVDDLDALRLWVESRPEVPAGEWYQDFGSFKVCGEGSLPQTFLLKGQAARGRKL